MRFFTLFIFFFSLQSFADENSMRTLSTLEARTSNGQVVLVPTHGEIEFDKYLTENLIQFQYQGQTLVVESRIFLHTVQLSSGEFFSEYLSGTAAMGDPALCPVDANGQLKSGVKWNYAAARALVDHCAPMAVNLVRRAWSGVFSKSCRPPSQDLSVGATWKSCSPPPDCSATDEFTKRTNGQLRLEAWKKKCAGQSVTIPPDNDPSCQMNVGAPHTLVIHQTEAPQTAGPDAVQSMHLERGWDDIGYHFVLTKTKTGWRSFEGRPEGKEGSHAGAGLNAGSIAISVSGNYLPSANPGTPKDQVLPPPRALLLLKSMILAQKAKYPTIKYIYGHGEYKMKGSGCDTDCPSPSIQAFVDRMRAVYF